MPIYEYKCKECGNIIEIIHSINEKIDEYFCNKCNKNTKFKKIISSCNFKLEGGGWAKDGYVKPIDAVKEAM